MKRFFSILTLFCLFSWPVAGLAESAALAAALSGLKNVKGAYTFAIIGDNRSGDRVYKKVIHQMNLRKPLFVVNTGDVIPNPGNRKQWANFREISKEITIPYFLVAGNHDIDDKESQDVWRDEVDLPGNETHYSFVVGRDLFVILNSCEPGLDRKIAGQQLEWLGKILNLAKYERQFVFLHHPLFLSANADYSGKSMDKYPELRDSLHRLFVEKRVNAVFAGHEHTFWRAEKDGVDYIITGGAGAPLYGKDSFSHLMIVRVDGPRVSAKTIDRDGALRDEFAIGR